MLHNMKSSILEVVATIQLNRGSVLPHSLILIHKFSYSYNLYRDTYLQLVCLRHGVNYMYIKK